MTFPSPLTNCAIQMRAGQAEGGREDEDIKIKKTFSSTEELLKGTNCFFPSTVKQSKLTVFANKSALKGENESDLGWR